MHLLRRVDADGWISLPWVEKLPVVTRTGAEVARTIDEIYREKGLIQEPNATVERIAIDGASPPEPGPFAPGDFVHVQMWDLQGPGVETRLIRQVREDGIIELPPKVTIKVADLSESEMEEAAAKAYREAQLIARLQVAVLRVSPDEAKALKAQLKK